MNEKITNITYESKTVNFHTVYKFDIKYDYTWEGYGGFKKETTNNRSVTIHQQPTGNCQLSTICTFVNLTCFNDGDLQKLFKFIYDKTYVKLLLFDINEEYINRLEKLFSKEYVCFKNEYTSTNNSEMCLFGINLRKFIQDTTPEEKVETNSNVTSGFDTTIEEYIVPENTDSDFEEEPIINKVTKVKPKRDGSVIHHISPQQREQIRNISNRHKF